MRPALPPSTGAVALRIWPRGPVAVPIGPGMRGYGWFALSEDRSHQSGEFARGARILAELLDWGLERSPPI